MLKEYAEEENLLFLEASAKTGVNVSEVFEKLAGRLPKTEAQLASSRAFGRDQDWTWRDGNLHNHNDLAVECSRSNGDVQS